MRNAVIALAGTLLVLAGTTQAIAQAAPPRGYGTPGTERTNSLRDRDVLRSKFVVPDEESAPDTYAVGLNIARCIVSLGGGSTGSLLGGASTDDETYRDLIRAMRQRYATCAHDANGVSPMVVNYALAEALVLKDAAPVPTDRAASVNVDEADAFQSLGTEPVTMDQLARCLTVYSPGLARKVIDTAAGSPEEAAALSELYGKSPECGLASPPGSIATVYQRGALAVAMYQWTHRDS